MVGPNITGFTVAQTISKNGVRLSAARAFLWPHRNRKNLHVVLNATVTKINVKKTLHSKVKTEGITFTMVSSLVTLIEFLRVRLRHLHKRLFASHGDDLLFVERPKIQCKSEEGSNPFGRFHKFASASTPIGHRTEESLEIRGDSHSCRSAGSRRKSPQSCIVRRGLHSQGAERK